jgi:RNA polymerase sigma-70 factor (ECF subfamily)
MRLSEPPQDIGAAPQRIFATTHWSVVMAAGENDSEESRGALEKLCDDYWYPIYVYVRRKGYGPDDAQDLTQEFFAQLIAKNHLRLADHRKGRFRSFLLATLHYFLAREWCRAHRQKRGGQYRFLSLDQQADEEKPGFEPADDETPEKKFQRQWALTVLKQAMNTLHEECETTGKARLFGEVKHLLSGECDGASYASIAGGLSMSESALRVAVHRLRQRYGQLLRAEIGRTVGSKAEVEEELRCLLKALTG